MLHDINDGIFNMGGTYVQNNNCEVYPFFNNVYSCFKWIVAYICGNVVIYLLFIYVYNINV